MGSIVQGKIWKLGDSISTDGIIPGRYYHLRGDLKALSEHALEDADPRFAKEGKSGTILVAGYNFGQGSSREHAALVLRERGVKVILAKSFARIFFRNAVNVGLVPIICDLSDVQTGDEIEVSLADGVVRVPSRGIERSFEPLPPVMRAIFADGGLVAHILKRGGFRWDNAESY